MNNQTAVSAAPLLMVRDATVRESADVLTALSSTPAGLTTAEATARRAVAGQNVLREHRARPWRVLGRQLKSPILILLFVTAVVSMFLGEAANAVIIGIILAASIGLGFVNEYRAERTADALHDRIRHTVITHRDGAPTEVDVTDLVPGDIVHLNTGTVVPADMRLLDAHNLACDESIVTGESLPTGKTTQPVHRGAGIGDLTSCTLMGTVVQSGTGTAVVVATGSRTEFGRIAGGLATEQPQTEFQRGLGRFSILLLEVALILTTVIFVANVLLQRPVLDALLFSLAIAVGITPQLLPAVVSTSLAAGSRALTRRRVLVKRLVCIEDLGDMDILVTDKTGTLTEGRISFIPAGAPGILDQEYAAGGRVVAVATKPAAGLSALTPGDENGLTLARFLVFLDRPKSDARASLDQLASLGIAVKIATGDNAVVAEKVLRDLGIASGGTLTGSDIDALSDDALRQAASTATIFARVSPEQKARIIRMLRRAGRGVGFLGDGVNDALALHQADIGISVESAADVAKDAADVLLLDKDLGVLADGVTEGRRIFANTIKYVLMGTSSNFGNMFSASVASVVLPFLPMLPGQILLNNLLYDTGQLAIPGDRVDPEQLRAPSHWDIGFIRRFMLLFGPISSLFDFATFALMMLVFHAAEGEFQAGWFIESIATQTLIIFAIRTRRVPFFRSRPSTGLILASLAVVAAGVWLPYSPLAGLLGFQPLPAPFFLALVGMVIAYLVCVELAKSWFFARPAQQPSPQPPIVARMRRYQRRVHRRSARFTPRSPA